MKTQELNHSIIPKDEMELLDYATPRQYVFQHIQLQEIVEGLQKAQTYLEKYSPIDKPDSAEMNMYLEIIFPTYNQIAFFKTRLKLIQSKIDIWTQVNPKRVKFPDGIKLKSGSSEYKYYVGLAKNSKLFKTDLISTLYSKINYCFKFAREIYMFFQTTPARNLPDLENEIKIKQQETADLADYFYARMNTLNEIIVDTQRTL